MALNMIDSEFLYPVQYQGQDGKLNETNFE